ncbi:purine-nucleoside phosphorylase [Amycolatopsis sp. A1MSW2902]
MVNAPTAAVACFFPEIIATMTEGVDSARPLLELPSRIPLWEIKYSGQRLALFYPGTGAPLAAYTMERVIASGCRNIIACGGAGAVQPNTDMGESIFIVSEAVRDEGTSYHYLPPSRSVAADQEVASLLADVVTKRDLKYQKCKTWTTDAYFRETISRRNRRQEEGCETVEMEAAALIAVAAFRQIRFGQYLYAGDDISGAVWDSREWWHATELRHLVVELAAEAALRLSG